MFDGLCRSEQQLSSEKEVPGVLFKSGDVCRGKNRKIEILVLWRKDNSKAAF